jgi:hypothetical protein
MDIPVSVGSYATVDSYINELPPLMKAFPSAASQSSLLSISLQSANKYLGLSESDMIQCNDIGYDEMG